MTIIDTLEPFESPRLLIESAKASLLDFEPRVQSFLDGCTYDLVRKFDQQSGDEVIKAKLHSKMPGALRTTAYAIINDARNALDQAVCDGSVALGATTKANTYFPFGKDSDDLESAIKNRCKKVDPELVDFIRKLKPYLGGDSLLWAVATIAGPNKHQRLVHIALHTTGSFLGREPGRFGSPITLGINKWSELRNEIELIRVHPGGYYDGGFEPAFDVVFGEADIIGGAPVCPVLSEFVSKSESIVLGIEAEAARILRTRKA